MVIVFVVAATLALTGLGNYSKKNGCALNAAALHPCVSAHATPTPTPTPVGWISIEEACKTHSPPCNFASPAPIPTPTAYGGGIE